MKIPVSRNSSLLYSGELKVNGAGPNGILKKQNVSKAAEPFGFIETINHPIVPPKGEATLSVSVESSLQIHEYVFPNICSLKCGYCLTKCLAPTLMTKFISSLRVSNL